MISLIIAVAAIILLIVTVIIACSREYYGACTDTLVENVIPVVLMAVAFIFFMLMIAGVCDNVDAEEYSDLKFKADHFEELSFKDQVNLYERVNEWNKRLNSRNNIFFKFAVEDRSCYFIELEEI